MYGKILKRIKYLRKVICTMYDIREPLLHIYLTNSEESDGFGGATMAPGHRKNKMYIIIIFSHTIDQMLKEYDVETTIDIMVIHEFSHYIDAQCMTNKQLDSLYKQYAYSRVKRLEDENRVWKLTKKISIKLNLWTESFYKELKSFEGASKLTF